MNALVIHNPWAGPFPAEGVVRTAMLWWLSQGWQVAQAETRRPGDATRLARQAAEDGLDAVIVAGGDGTLSQAAHGLAGSETALGLLALGTANVWARDVGLPIIAGRGQAAALRGARALATAEVRAVDMCRAGDRRFLLWLGLGLDGHVVARVEPRGRLAKYLGTPFYMLAALFHAMSWKGVPIRLEVDGREISSRTLLTLVGNTRRYGGGLFNFSPEAVLDDGLVEVLVFEGDTFGAALSHAFAALRGRHRNNPRVQILPARHISITGPQAVPMEIDGELFQPSLPLEIAVIPGAIRMLTPAAAPPGLFNGRAWPAPVDML